MPFNPCGRGVDYLRSTVTDHIKPFRDSDTIVRRRWYRVPEGTPLLGVPSAFLSDRYEAFPWLPKNVGEVYPDEVTYTKNVAPDGLDYDHVCGTPEDFQIGAVFDPDLFVVYDSNWIPLCCGALDVCTNQLCGQDQVHERPAAQLWSYPINHQDATGTTPVHLDQWALNEGNDTPAKPGWLESWYPAGIDGAVGWSREQIATSAGVMESDVDTIRFAVDNAITMTRDATGYALAVEAAGGSGTITARIVGGVLELCGTNATICAALMPVGTVIRASAPLVGTGTAQAGATLLGPGAWGIRRNTAANTAFVLGADTGSVIDVLPTFAGTVSIYPPAGEQIGALGVDAPLVLDPAATPTRAYRLARYSHPLATPPATWTVSAYDVNGGLATGTVTSVDISTSSAAVTVGGGPVTAAGTLTVDVDGALEDLVALAAVDGIVAGDGAGGLVTVSIGDYLTYSGGVLDVTPPTASSGQQVCSTFAVTGATGVYQATGDTITLPAAGTYLITAQIRGAVQPSAPSIATMLAKLHDNTTAADVPNTETLLARSVGAANIDTSTSALTTVYTVTGATVVELYAARTGTSWSTSSIFSDSGGRTVLNWVKLAN